MAAPEQEIAAAMAVGIGRQHGPAIPEQHDRGVAEVGLAPLDDREQRGFLRQIERGQRMAAVHATGLGRASPRNPHPASHQQHHAQERHIP